MIRLPKTLVKHGTKALSIRCDRAQSTRKNLWASYEQAQSWLRCKKLPSDVDPGAVFCNDDVNLSDVEVYGFDYDYTLASYKKGVEFLIHDNAQKRLVEECGYPQELLTKQYSPIFGIRGLHYDVEKGLFLKVDGFHQIQLGTVYRGSEKLSDDVVLQKYKKRHIPLHYFDSNIKAGNINPKIVKMVQLVDVFAKPEMSLICDVIDLFRANNVSYEPASIYYDVTKCIGRAHQNFHQEINLKPHIYLHKDSEQRPFLQRLSAEKKVFLITNSPFSTINVGMTYMVGEDWMDLFDVIIVTAGKPHFFTNNAQPLRELNLKTGTTEWGKVTELKKGRIYVGGTISDLERLTGWAGGKVMYFGDHPYADLADVTLVHGWKTAAIIRELEQEIAQINTDEYKWAVNWMQILKSLIDEHQQTENSEELEVLDEWNKEVGDIELKLKQMFNPYFGSAFRSYNNPTYFSRRLFRFSDIYTSRVTNLLQYSLKHKFYPRRGVLPHEFKSWFV